MSKKIPSKKEELKLLAQISKRALQNGIDFYNDAKTIYENNKSYGHAFGLLVLAEEEFAKAWFLHYCHEMIRNDVWYFSRQKEEEALKISDIISNHKAKQFFLEYLRKATIVLIAKTESSFSDDISGERAIQIIEEFWEEVENPNDKEVKKIFKKIEQDCRSMQRVREMGFYVDIDGNNNRIIAPDQITQKKCEEQFTKTQASYYLCEIWCEMWGREKMNKKEIALLKKFQKRLNESFEDLEKS